MCKIDKFGTAIILAGGKSSRMGFDKQFLEINKVRVMDILIKQLEKIFNEIIVVTNKPEEYKDFKHKVVSDIIKGKGPLSGLHVGLKHSKSKYAYFIACDMPNINLDYIDYIKQKIEESNCDACVTRSGKFVEVFNAFYNKKLYRDIENHLNNGYRSINSLLEKTDTFYVEEKEARSFSDNWDMFVNLNTSKQVKEYIDQKK